MKRSILLLAFFLVSLLVFLAGAKFLVADGWAGPVYCKDVFPGTCTQGFCVVDSGGLGLFCEIQCKRPSGNNSGTSIICQWPNAY
ncbi:MAG: hypothetical protein H5U07_11015 [Candidatus Aminicenantes bacterium]|nr:hypothetical protein [Candidatus Aminicenantes bacterium]